MKFLILFALVPFVALSSPALQKECVSDADPGNCYASVDRYYYHSGSNTCKRFTFGGCGGNGNNYVSKRECEDSCKLIDCVSPKDEGPCRSNQPRYYFDTRTGSCRRFYYGGCQGNDNRYDTYRACFRVCVHR